MTTPIEDSIIQDAGKVIERFGGIRPMAKKLNVPVTTVQGWKNRDAIPFSRREDLLETADIYRIDLSDFSWAAANQNEGASLGSMPAAAYVAASQTKVDEPAAAPIEFHSAKPSAEKPAEHHLIDLGKIRATSFWTAFITATAIGALVLGVGAVLFKNGKTVAPAADTKRIEAVEVRVQALENTPQTSMATELAGKLGGLMGWLGYTEAQGTPAQTVADRLAAIELKLSTATPAQLGQQLQGAIATATGTTNNADLQAMFDTLRARVDALEPTVKAAAESGQTANETLNSITSRDATAAGLLFALVQYRDATQRTAPLTQDLAIVRALVAPQDPELAKSIDKLSPYAQSGIMSPAALSQQLAGLTADVLAAKARGEDVNVWQRFKDRMQSFFTVRKDGKTVMGNTAEQQAIDAARAQLDKGDVKGAMATLQALNPDAQKVLAPWQSQAQATVIAQDVDAGLVALVQKFMQGQMPAPTKVIGGAVVPQ